MISEQGVKDLLNTSGYIADDAIATAVFLAADDYRRARGHLCGDTLLEGALEHRAPHQNPIRRRHPHRRDSTRRVDLAGCLSGGAGRQEGVWWCHGVSRWWI